MTPGPPVAATRLRIAIPDMISPSYFPAIAAVELGLFEAEGLDATIELVFPHDVDIGPVPGSEGAGVSFGVTAAKALEDGALDAFWANGMGAEVAIRRGVGRVLLDARRGDGPPGAEDYTFAAL